jgi:hypothetical protein
MLYLTVNKCYDGWQADNVRLGLSNASLTERTVQYKTEENKKSIIWNDDEIIRYTT